MSRIARPSPAILVAVIALVAALAGTAIAGPGAQTSAITKAKVKKIANKQINKRIPWQTADIADAAITAPKLAAIDTHEQTVSVTDNYFEITANCDTGERVISGGVKVNNPNLADFTPYVFESHKEGNGWYVRGYNVGSRQVTAEAYCLQ
jgi:hypothetical protein